MNETHWKVSRNQDTAEKSIYTDKLNGVKRRGEKREKNTSLKDSKESNERKKEGGEIGRSLLFDWLIVDKTHCILIFNHSFDELSLSQSLCEGKKKE